MTTAYERCGGEPRLRPIITEFYRRVLRVPRLARHFEGVDVGAVADGQFRFVAWVMEGPVHFTDEAIRRAHAGKDISREEFLEMAGLMRQALLDGGVDRADVDHVMRAVMRREPLVVENAARRQPRR